MTNLPQTQGPSTNKNKALIIGSCSAAVVGPTAYLGFTEQGHRVLDWWFSDNAVAGKSLEQKVVSDVPEREEELSVQGRTTTTKKPEGKRIGCVCMDGMPQELTGGGACAGHGGVRYWLYRTSDETIVQYATRRHKEHPLPLSEEELGQLGFRKSKKEAEEMYHSSDAMIYQSLSVMIICVTFALLIHFILQQRHVELSNKL